MSKSPVSKAMAAMWLLFHADHAGGLPALARMIPIEKCFDRGDFMEPANQSWRDGYLSVCATRRTIVKAGDRIPLKGLQVDVIASNARLLAKPITRPLAKPINGGGPKGFFLKE